MLHTVHLDELNQLELLTTAVTRRFVRSGAAAIGERGRLVRELHIADKLYSEKDEFKNIDAQHMMRWSSPIVTTLVALPLLGHFALYAVPMTRMIVACLAPPPYGCLTSLIIRISFVNGLSADVTSHINQLQRLKRLEIIYHHSEGWTHDQYAFDIMEPLSLPAVRYFGWFETRESTHQEAVYLSSCRFHPACSVFLDLFDYAHDLAADLAPFFAAYAFVDATLHLSPYTFAGLTKQIAEIEHVKLLREPPPHGLLRHGRLPSTLKISIQLHHDELEEEVAANLVHFWEFLRQVPPFAERGSRTTELSIIVDVAWINEPTEYLGREFRWADGANPDYAAFIGRLTTEAARLYSEGVIIVDEEGRNITQLVR
jgi:hypothetical protein